MFGTLREIPYTYGKKLHMWTKATYNYNST